MASSIHHELTTLSNGEFPATEVIKYLVKVVGHDACSAQRNAQTTYAFVQRARDIGSKINELIGRVEADNTNWVDFLAYTGMIDPLEDVLLKFAITIESEALLYLPTTEDLSLCLESLNTWKTNRTSLRSSIETLMQKELSGTASSLEVSEIQWAQKHDDLALFAALANRIIASRLTKERGIGRKVTAAVAHLASIESGLQEDNPTETVVVISIQFAMLLYGVMEVAIQTKDAKMSQHLRSDSVWNLASSLAQDLGKHLQNASSVSVETIQTQWEEFKRLLKDLSGIVPLAFEELLKYPAQLRRPYYAQAVQLVKQCHFLVKRKDITVGDTTRDPTAPERAIKAAKEALEIAQKARPAAAVFDSNLRVAFKKAEVDKAFEQAGVAIEACFNDYELSQDWTTFEKDMASAKALDEDHLQRLEARVTNAQGKVSTTPKNTLKVSLKASNAPKSFTPKTIDVDADTILTTILAKELAALPLAERKNVHRVNPCTLKAGGKDYEWLSLGDSVTRLTAGADGVRNLHFVFSKESSGKK
ncbi:hypothetical protein HGRIS_006821 [Hohenbuehelia grisea]|uniref:Uncharacterized protein n=1 Tax=Hohenbuehelia grisea TaxID=104357 RepID=A0ABR3JA55_9AGAR